MRTIGAALTMMAMAAAAPASAQTAPATTIQQDFEAATALGGSGNNAAALAAWEALERRVKSGRSLALVRLRKSGALLRLDRRDEAAAAARAGLDGLPAGDPTLREDRFDAYLRLAQIAEVALDYASAVASYRAAGDIAATSTERLTVLRGLVETQTFVDPDAALADAARAEAMLAEQKVDKRAAGMMRTVIAQLHLNRGDFAAARKEAGEAVKVLGGLTSTTDLYDVAARSTYALAALKLKDIDGARRYMALTGAGRLAKGEFDPAVEMQAPPCGEGGLRPEDEAIIQFSIGADGTVTHSTPVYGSRKGDMALVFARTARTWAWTPEQMRLVDPFYRTRVRLEMRCSREFARPALTDFLAIELTDWLATKSVATPPPPEGPAAPRLAEQQAALARLEREAGPDALALVPALTAVARNPALPRESGAPIAARALAIVRAHQAPPLVRLAAEYPVWAGQGADRNASKAFRNALSAAMQDPVYTADPRARAALSLMLAEYLHRKDPKRATLLQAVADDPALAATDNFKVGALVRLASLRKAAGDVAAAQVAFERSGVSAEQCALLDAEPRLLRSGASDSDFPMAALQWGFEGWVKLEFDISAEGRTEGSRALIAYPPFVFSEAGLGMARDFRYAASFRPDGKPGCGGANQRITFRIP